MDVDASLRGGVEIIGNYFWPSKEFCLRKNSAYVSISIFNRASTQEARRRRAIVSGSFGKLFRFIRILNVIRYQKFAVINEYFQSCN